MKVSILSIDLIYDENEEEYEAIGNVLINNEENGSFVITPIIKGVDSMTIFQIKDLLLKKCLKIWQIDSEGKCAYLKKG